MKRFLPLVVAVLQFLRLFLLVEPQYPCAPLVTSIPYPAPCGLPQGTVLLTGSDPTSGCCSILEGMNYSPVSGSVSCEGITYAACNEGLVYPLFSFIRPNHLHNTYIDLIAVTSFGAIRGSRVCYILGGLSVVECGCGCNLITQFSGLTNCTASMAQSLFPADSAAAPLKIPIFRSCSLLQYDDQKYLLPFIGEPTQCGEETTPILACCSFLSFPSGILYSMSQRFANNRYLLSTNNYEALLFFKLQHIFCEQSNKMRKSKGKNTSEVFCSVCFQSSRKTRMIQPCNCNLPSIPLLTKD